jgi:uncharacterized membrane protein
MDCLGRDGAVVTETDAEREPSSGLPLKLLLFGFVLTFVGIIVVIASIFMSGEANVSGGAIIFVGPIPIIVGAGTDALLALVLAAVLTIIGFVMFLWMRKQFPRR